jgi:methylmalonyl-CoA/ethylmalonyl-CoA epimerase
MAEAQRGAALGRIGQIAVTVKDLARATAFYRDVLGIPMLYEFPGLAFFDAGGVRLMLSRAEDPRFDHPASILYYRVDDITAAHAALESHSVRVEEAPHMIAKMPDHELWIASYLDSEDNHFALMSEVRGAGAPVRNL